jgi:DNA gyrase/topoisomerase IV subunit B
VGRLSVLKGKILNVRDVSADKFSKNEELTAIKNFSALSMERSTMI